MIQNVYVIQLKPNNAISVFSDLQTARQAIEDYFFDDIANAENLQHNFGQLGTITKYDVTKLNGSLIKQNICWDTAEHEIRLVHPELMNSNYKLVD